MRPHTSRSPERHGARTSDSSFARIRPGDHIVVRPGLNGTDAGHASDDSQVLEVTDIVYGEDEVIGLNVAYPPAGQGQLVFAGAEFAARDNEPVNLVTVLALSALCGAAIWAILTFSP